METQKATLPTVSGSGNSLNLDTKEEISSVSLMAYDEKKHLSSHKDGYGYRDGTSPGMRLTVQAHWYMGRSASASVVYCRVMINQRGGNLYHYGEGSAGGGGYCKHSAAFQEALEKAGVSLSIPVDGVGMSAVREAMIAIAKAAGYGRCPKGWA